MPELGYGFVALSDLHSHEKDTKISSSCVYLSLIARLLILLFIFSDVCAIIRECLPERQVESKKYGRSVSKL